MQSAAAHQVEAKNTCCTKMVKDAEILVKLLLLGDSTVGKTCLLFRYSDDVYNTTYMSTIGIDFKHKTIDLGGKLVKLQMWDTAGQERFHSLAQQYYRGAQGILLVYDITNWRTFENVTNWLYSIRQHATDEVTVMLVGNKKDQEEMRQVSTYDGEQLAKEYGIRFQETSAKQNRFVDKAFEDLTVLVLERMVPKYSSDAIKAPSIDLKEEDQKSKCCCMTTVR